MPQILRDAGLSELIAGELEVLAAGFQFTEGPLWLPDGRLLFQDLKASRTYYYTSTEGACVLRENTRGANGQTIDSEGWVVFCEQDGRRISRMRPDGSDLEVLVETFEGRRLNSPNDLVARGDGALFFTDPAYGVPHPEDKELPFQGIFAYRYADRSLSLVCSEGFEKPNGLAFTPDGQTLYVNDTGRYHVRRLRLGAGPDLRLEDDRIFATFDPSEPGGPDGIKLDTEGRLYVAVAQGIWVLDADGALLGILATPKRPSNLAWGESDARTLYITMVDQVLRVRLDVVGLMPRFSSVYV